jgi:hypothetical protein
VDHVIPITGKDDLRRLDFDNTQSSCDSCHSAKTREEQRHPRSFDPAPPLKIVF